MSNEPERTRGKVDFDGTLSREEAASYFEAIVTGLRRGSVEFRQGGEHLHLDIGDLVEIEVKAQRKGERGRVTFEMSWRADRPGLTVVPGSE